MLFLLASAVIFSCDYILGVYSKSTVLLIPSILFLLALLLFYPYTFKEKPYFLPLPVAAVSAALFYGIFGQSTATVGIVEYYLVIAQSLCLLLILISLSFSQKAEQEESAV